MLLRRHITELKVINGYFLENQVNGQRLHVLFIGSKEAFSGELMIILICLRKLPCEILKVYVFLKHN